MCQKMDSFEIGNTVTYECVTNYEDFPRTSDPVVILGCHYSTLYDIDELKHDIFSRIWFTYRKGFRPIGGTGPTEDKGWGCMLRCGQMMLAQALVMKNLHRDWRWYRGNDSVKYWKILQMFEDKARSCYSIHQIASMGESEGKNVGQWFGPNTVAQVLKKLSAYDKWSNITIYIAMDNTLVIEDVYDLCKIGNKRVSHQEAVNCNSDSSSVMSENTTNNTHGASCQQNNTASTWKPLLLMIPLRLGLSDINSVYFDSLKVCFELKQSVGIIGGKPNHAHWFIGYVGDYLVYLDPHTTQPVVEVSCNVPDDSYHCPMASRMNISKLDPSVALGFFCNTESEFDELCQSFRRDIIKSKTPMFEINQTRPVHWPPHNVNMEHIGAATGSTEFSMVKDRQYDTDEEYELL